jgi:Protein of unknown function (DUF3780)
VDIPGARTEPVVITENFGMKGSAGVDPDLIVRCKAPRAAWSAIAEEAKRVLNERLKEKKIATSRWSSGVNKVERLLGRELCVLAWAVEAAPKDLIPAAVRNWVALRPDERWWLFSMAATTTGAADDIDVGWRKAIRIAMTENPTGEEVTALRAMRRKLMPEERPPLPLFEDL